jgi:hypothetical protein
VVSPGIALERHPATGVDAARSGVECLLFNLFRCWPFLSVALCALLVIRWLLTPAGADLPIVHCTEANNRNAYDLALSYYKARMDEVVGPEKAYVKEAALQAVHDALYIAAFEQFDEIATMGKWL